tara:strand:+ start:291 stop:422 length:132 start_codon:yes stop_codon:yes gene_type:complete
MKKFKPLTEMTKAELKDWKLWAQEEVREYQDFIEEINEHLENR